MCVVVGDKVVFGGGTRFLKTSRDTRHTQAWSCDLDRFAAVMLHVIIQESFD